MKRLYRASLFLLPSPFREKYGSEMESAFLEACARRQGLARCFALPLAVFDVVRTRWMLWRAEPSRAPQRRSPHMELLLSDIQYAWRSLKNRWTLALLALATLAMGIGATTAVFSVVGLRGFVWVNSDRKIV